jgi:DNA-binding transcriptional ArsR family regulator
MALTLSAGLDHSAVLTGIAIFPILKRMVKYWEGLDEVFHALADPTRRAMVERLAHGPASVSQLGEPFEVSLPAIVGHIKVLESAGIVASTKVGRVRTVQLVPDAFASARLWLDRQRPATERQLDRLEQVVERTLQRTQGEQS